MAIVDCLPREFDFYHLGRVELSDEPARLPGPRSAFAIASDDRVAMAYSIEGDARGAIVLLFDGTLDVSTYSECGNIIASHLATTLAAREGGEVTISPPRQVPLDRLPQLMAAVQVAARTYLHKHEGRTVRLTTLILNDPKEGAGHA